MGTGGYGTFPRSTGSSLDADDLAERMEDLHEVFPRLHDGLDAGLLVGRDHAVAGGQGSTLAAALIEIQNPVRLLLKGRVAPRPGAA